ncbi:MAG: hypothetical protein WAW37_15045, partial [Syntrophobacteraceae bacterium]
ASRSGFPSWSLGTSGKTSGPAKLAKALRLKGEGFKPGAWKNKNPWLPRKWTEICIFSCANPR